MTSPQDVLKHNATSTLAHYFRTLYRQAGLQWTTDHERKIAGAVSAIVAATLEALKEAAEAQTKP